MNDADERSRNSISIGSEPGGRVRIYQGIREPELEVTGDGARGSVCSPIGCKRSVISLGTVVSYWRSVKRIGSGPVENT